MESAAWNTAFVESVGSMVFPDGVQEALELVFNEKEDVEDFEENVEFDILGRCLCGHMGNPYSWCENCRGPFVPPLGRCEDCLTATSSVSGPAGSKFYYCDGILVGDEPPIVNNKTNPSITDYFFDCVDSYDSHITYPSSNDVKSPIVAKVYFEYISSLSGFDNLQLDSNGKVNISVQQYYKERNSHF